MSYQSEFYDALLNDAGISALVGDRVFSDIADGSTTAPYITFQFITAPSETTHDRDRGLVFPLIQVNAWANGRAEAISVADAVDAAIGGKTILGYSGLSLVFSDQQSRHESETNLYGEIIDYRGACKTN